MFEALTFLTRVTTFAGVGTASGFRRSCFVSESSLHLSVVGETPARKVEITHINIGGWYVDPSQSMQPAYLLASCAISLSVGKECNPSVLLNSGYMHFRPRLTADLSG